MSRPSCKRLKLVYLGLGACLAASQGSIGFALPIDMSTLSTGEFGAGRLVVNMSFYDGQRTVAGPMRLDTGASSSRITRSEWNKGFSLLGSSLSLAADGSSLSCEWVEAERAMLGRIGRSGYQLERCPATGSDDLLGIDFFFGTVVVLDPRHRLLDVSPSQTPSFPPSSHLNPLRLLETSLGLIGMDVQVSGQSVTAFFDSGAEMSAVDSEFIKAHPEFFEKVESGERRLKMAQGQNPQAKVYKIMNLHVDQLELHGEYVVAYDFGPMRKVLGKNTPLVFGFSTIEKARWSLDLKNFQWSAEPSRSTQTQPVLGSPPPQPDQSKG